MGWISATVSALAGAAALVGWLTLWVFGDKSMPRVSMILLGTGMTGIAGAVPVIREAVTWADHGLRVFAVHWVAVGVVGVLWSVLLSFVGVKFYRKSIDDRVMVIAALVPMIVPFIPGRLGAIATWLVYGPADFIGWAFTSLLGLH